MLDILLEIVTTVNYKDVDLSKISSHVEIHQKKELSSIYSSMKLNEVTINEFRASFANFESKNEKERKEACKVVNKLLSLELDGFVDSVKNYTYKQVGTGVREWIQEDFFMLLDEFNSAESAIENLFEDTLTAADEELFGLYVIRLGDIVSSTSFASDCDEVEICK